MEYELRPEYDLKSMRVRKLGAGRCDVAETAMQKERAKRGSRAKYEAILAKVKDVEPEVYDR